MGLTTVNSDGVKDDSIKNADIKSDAAIAKSKLAALNIGASDITDDTITEAKLDISNTASDGQYLQYKDNSDKLTWATVTVPSSYDDTNVRKDISKLALQIAVDTNRAAYNLTNSFIDQFENDTGIGTETNVNRDPSGEYVSTIAYTQTAFAPSLKNYRSDPSPNLFTRTSSTVTNDTYELDFNGGGDPNYPGVLVDHLFDLHKDWKLYLYYNDATGGQSGRKYGAFTVLITTDTSVNPGPSPSIFGSPHDNGNGINIGKADWGNNRTLTTAYGTTALGVESYAETSTSGNSDQNIDANNTSHNIRHYENSNGSFHSGFVIEYVRSTNTITAKHLADGQRVTTSGDAEHTITNVPTSGRVLIQTGTGDPANNLYVSTTYPSNMANSSYYAVTSNATGTVIGAASTASSSRTKVSGTFLYKNAAGTATIGTDLKIYFTCNGGTNWTEAASYTVGSDFSSGVKTIYLGETTCTAGTDVRYKAEWANQATGSKVTELHGIGVNY